VAEIAEQPAGPVPDPQWDIDVLTPAIDAFHGLRDSGAAVEAASEELVEGITGALTSAWDHTWQALDLVRALPEAASVTDRWKDDRDGWTFHARRVEDATAHFRRIPTPLGAARLLAKAEDAAADLDRQMALDDPFVMASVLARGDA